MTQKKGKIVSWKVDQGYGFVRVFNGEKGSRDAFLHINNINPKQGFKPDLYGRIVTFTDVIKTSPKGPVIKSAILEPLPYDEVSNKKGANLIVPLMPEDEYKHQIKIDGNNVDSIFVKNAFKVNFCIDSYQTNKILAKNEVFLKKHTTYLLMHITYEGLDTVYVHKSKGLKEVYTFGDGYGQSWAGLFELNKGKWSINYSVPYKESREFCHIKGNKNSFTFK